MGTHFIQVKYTVSQRPVGKTALSRRTEEFRGHAWWQWTKDIRAVIPRLAQEGDSYRAQWNLLRLFVNE